MAKEVQWISVTALFLSAVIFASSASVDLTNIHEHMTVDELFSTFNVKDRAAIPDYEVVPILHKQNSHRNRRSISSSNHEDYYTVTVKNLELYLEPVNHTLLGENTPVYLASGNKSHPHGIRYKRLAKAWPSNFTMYQDPANNAALALSKDSKGKVYFEGTIGHDLVIKPVPSRLRSISSPFKSEEDANHHFVYKKKSFNIDSYFDDFSKYFGYVPPRKPQRSRPESKVDVVYPQVLVIVDHETYLAHGKDPKALAKYMAMFWNAVDLRYRAMKQPKVRLNIAGLIVPTDKYGAPYMTYHREGKHYLRSSETMIEVGEYLYKEERLGKNMYDLTVVITSFNLCSTTRVGCNPSVLGLARLGGACDHDEDEVDVAVAVTEDAGGFDGVLTVAHEIGHLLGSTHDGDNSYFGPGAEDCDPREGHLMTSSQQSSSNAFLWSDCSIKQMQYFLRREGECLRNKPVVKKSYPKILPGQLMSRDEQCKTLLGMVACKGYAEDECGELYCRKPGGRFMYECMSTRPPAEGSPCSDGGMCLDGMCVHMKDENKVVTERTTTTAAPERMELISDADD